MNSKRFLLLNGKALVSVFAFQVTSVNKMNLNLNLGLSVTVPTCVPI